MTHEQIIFFHPSDIILRVEKRPRISQGWDEFKDADFFLGDFNALNPGDYQEKDWKDIVSVRNKLKLEVTKPFVIEQIKSCGFSINPYLGPTTPYNTRVDYFCYKDKFGGDFFMIDTMGPKISDHNMIGIKF